MAEQDIIRLRPLGKDAFNRARQRCVAPSTEDRPCTCWIFAFPLMAGFITGAITFWSLAAGSRRTVGLWSWWMLAWLCVAAAMLTKGLSPLFFLAVALPI